jgi:hypothetical protein
MAVQESQPSGSFRDVYEQLGVLLARSDDAFIEEGPGIVQDALDDPTFLEGIETEPATDSYTRAKAMGEPGEHVVRFMEWPPEFPLMPHEHHGRPCFEVLVAGTLFLANMDVDPVEDDRYELSVRETTVCRPGDAGIVDPRTGSDVHSVYSPVRARSLHFYPDDNYSGHGYVLDEESERDLYERREFTLRERD